MHNPFKTIEDYLCEIKSLLLEQKHSQKNILPVSTPSGFRYKPIQEIFKEKICSKPTFYAHLKAGEFTLYKFGSKSFVLEDEFLNSFHKVKLNNVNPCKTNNQK